MFRASLLAIAAGAAFASSAALAQARDFDLDAALATSRAAVGRLIGDAVLRDADGREVRLSSFRGKPLVVSLVYTSCLRVCPTITRTLAEHIESARAVVGAHAFSVVTIGFDARADTPARMARFARAQGIDDPDWRFLSGDAATVSALARDLGFTYLRTPGGFQHLAQTSILDSDGRLYQQIYGDQFEAPALVEPLKALAFDRPQAAGTLDALVERVRLVCTFYDPVTGRYTLDYSLFIGLAIGGMSLSAVGFVIVRSWLRLRRQRLA